MRTLPLQIVTPAETIYAGEVLSVVLPAHDGERGVLPNHADFIGKLGTGVVLISAVGGKNLKFAVSDGAYQVKAMELTIMAMDAIRPENVNLEQVREQLVASENSLSSVNSAAEDISTLERTRDFCKAQLTLK